MGDANLVAWSPWESWIVAALVLAILETLSLQFIALGLALGCLGGALGSCLGPAWAVGAFAVVTLVALLVSRRLVATGRLSPQGAPTNTAALIGAP